MDSSASGKGPFHYSHFPCVAPEPAQIGQAMQDGGRADLFLHVGCEILKIPLCSILEPHISELLTDMIFPAAFHETGIHLRALQPRPVGKIDFIPELPECPVSLGGLDRLRQHLPAGLRPAHPLAVLGKLIADAYGLIKGNRPKRVGMALSPAHGLDLIEDGAAYRPGVQAFLARDARPAASRRFSAKEIPQNKAIVRIEGKHKIIAVSLNLHLATGKDDLVFMGLWNDYLASWHGKSLHVSLELGC